MADAETIRVVVLVSAEAEWRAVRAHFPDAGVQQSPFGQWFFTALPVRGQEETVCFLHGGWGKIAAAASTQYALDRWAPRLVVNLGTCGGFGPDVSAGTVVLVERTVVYDIVELMGDYGEALAHYMTDINLNWLTGKKYPQPVFEGVMVSADTDLQPGDTDTLAEVFEAQVADWESGAIAWVAARSRARCLILRGVTDRVDAAGSEAYGNEALFQERAAEVMTGLLDHLPAWLDLGIY